LLCLFVVLLLPDVSSAVDWQAGFAKVVITPEQPMFASGYGGRNKPSDGKIHDLYAKAAALRDPAGKTVVFVSTDLIGVPATMAKFVCDAVKKKHGLRRADVMITCSHTHCGPALDDLLSHMLAMNEQDWVIVREYQRGLNKKLVMVIDQAMADLAPARLSTGTGISRFAANRRAPKGLGPYDHSVPVLRVTSADGAQLRGVIFGYACHSTTLSFYQWCGDYGGFAQVFLEERHPGAVALFFAGCGGDQNPLPRRKVELAEKYGRMLALGVERVLAADMRPVVGRLRTDMRHVDLQFAALPSKADIEQKLQSSSRYEQARARVQLEEIARDGKLAASYPYPVQVWELGNGITWVALGGEIVVDYALRLKREMGEGRTWVTGYANDVMAYIPSERVLAEGGYEGGSSMLYYQLPSPWKSGLEAAIITAVRGMSESLRGERD
jgi:hypothetical protein